MVVNLICDKIKTDQKAYYVQSDEVLHFALTADSHKIRVLLLKLNLLLVNEMLFLIHVPHNFSAKKILALLILYVLKDLMNLE